MLGDSYVIKGLFLRIDCKDVASITMCSRMLNGGFKTG